MGYYWIDSFLGAHGKGGISYLMDGIAISWPSWSAKMCQTELDHSHGNYKSIINLNMNI